MSASMAAGRQPQTAAARQTAASAAPSRLNRSNRGHPNRAVALLFIRLGRRATLLLAVAAAAYAGLEVASYHAAYPDGVSPMQFAMFADNPAVRMMNGVPSGLDTAGGFTIWDGGWIMQLLLSVWAILTTTRFLRGEEDTQRADLVLAGPLRTSRVTTTALVVVMGSGVLVATAVAVTMAFSGQELRGSLLLGLALAGVTATFAGVAGITSQLFEVRRRAAAWACALLGLAYVLRMVGNSADSRSWVRWATPLGWLEQLRAFGDDVDLRALLPMIVVPVALGWGTVALRARRDIGAALLTPERVRKPRTRLLGSPLAFAWRTNRGVLLGWALGLGVYSAILGGLLTTMIDWLAEDESYQRIMSQIGMSQALSLAGFLGLMAVMLGLAVALQVAWRVGAARAEEEAGRLEVMLARPVGRLRWLAGHVVLTVVGGLVLLAVVGLSVWFGAFLAGSGDLHVGDSFRAIFNVGPVVALAAGLAVLALGVAPRLTVTLPVTIIVVGFVMSLLGPALKWPQWVLNFSPFAHLAMVPAQPWAATSALVMLALAAIALAVGMWSFRRRDLATG